MTSLWIRFNHKRILTRERMITKVHIVLVQVSCLVLLLIGRSLGQVIPSRACPPDYEYGEHAYYDNFYSYDNAKKQCKERHGALPMPTQISWSESLSYADHVQRKTDEDEGVWIGVTVNKSKESGVIFSDADGVWLNDTEIRRLSLRKSDARFENLENRRLCVVFYPSSNDQFRPEECVGGRAKVVCRCTTGLQKRKAVEQTTTALPPPPNDPVKAGQKSLDGDRGNGSGNRSLLLGKASGGVPSNGDGTLKEKGTEDQKEQTPASTVTTILGIFLAVCVIATAYFIVTSRGKKLRERISRQMPYNRSQTNENGDSCRQRRLTSDDSSGYHRPIHVYEEILGRNPNRVMSCSSPIITNGQAVASLPRLPPPEPPSMFVEIHEIRPEVDQDVGYMRPSFHRHDGVPGDVRSPPPTGRPVFDFPTTPDTTSCDGLLDVPQHNLKYASVETVQTLLDGEVLSDEEYFVHEENEVAEYSNPSNNDTPTFVKLDDNQLQQRPFSPELIQNNRHSVANPYVDVNDITLCSPPPPGGSEEYQNERFLRTVVKVPPKKPRRTMKKKEDCTTPRNYLQDVSDDINDSERSPTGPIMPLYSEVNKTSKRQHSNDDDTGYLESSGLPSPGTDFFTIGYTPMGRNASRIMSQSSAFEVATYADIPELPEDTRLNNNTDHHNYELVTASSKGNHISQPVMLSTTNNALSESSLVCYEIPPEEYES